jgi:isopropylmalate/homocitrate/citramalate synthase
VSVTICEVGPRDGLQNESDVLEPSVRAELVDRLSATGLPRIEAVSFVHPDRVLQMAAAEEVVSAIERRDGVVESGLVLNEKGYGVAAWLEGILGRELPGQVYRAGGFPAVAAP